MIIKACPKCGSSNVGMGTINDGQWAGLIVPRSREFFRDACKDCGFRGNFLEFNSEKDYRIFYEELQKQKTK